MTRYSTEQQAQIIKMKSEGYSSRKIAKDLELSKSGVNDFVHRIMEENASRVGITVNYPSYDELLEGFNKQNNRQVQLLILPSEFTSPDADEAHKSVFKTCTDFMDTLFINEALDDVDKISEQFKNTIKNLPPCSKETIESRKESFREKVKKIEEEHEDNSVILFISDMHIPYHHKNLIPFLKGLKEKYKPTRVICLGDELDLHSLSFHDSDPDLMSAGDELKEAMKVIKQVEELFPIMDLVDSNHGSLAYRKAKHHGIPQHFIKGYNEVLGVGEGWKWHNDLTIKLPNGEDVYICHGKAVRGVQLSQNMGMSVVQGHHHSEFNIHYWANPKHLHFSLQAGCLIDDKSLAMAYNKLTLKRPIIGTALIVNGIPVLEAMPL